MQAMVLFCYIFRANAESARIDNPLNHTTEHSCRSLEHRIFTMDEARLHGKLMMVALFGVLQVSVIIQRHFKSWRFTSFIHGALGMCVLGLVYYSEYTFWSVFYVSYAEAPPMGRHHARLGFTICGVLTAQAVLGLMTKLLIMYKRSMYLLLITRKTHHMLGWVVNISGLTNIALGLTISGQNTELLDYIIYPGIGLLALIFIVLELYRYKSSYRIQTVSIRSINDTGLTLDMVPEQKKYSQIIKKIYKKKKKWVFFKNLVLDMSSFISSHPGGSYMLEGILAENSAKYLYGVSSYSKELLPYSHSTHALKLSKKFAFAEVGIPSGVLLSKNEDFIPARRTTWKLVFTSC
jgi:hypothetical protein